MTVQLSDDFASQVARTEWNKACGWYQQIADFRNQLPEEQELSERMVAMDAFRKEQGIPDVMDPGVIQICNGRIWLKLRNQNPHGRYLRQCTECGKLEFVDKISTASGLCDDCRPIVEDRKKAERVEVRREIRRERSIELANRKGLCLVCGSEMTVARTTKTTCSDRCRKQLTRKGPKAFPLPEATTTVQLGKDGEVYPIAEAQKLLRFNVEKALSRRIAAVMNGDDVTEHKQRGEALQQMLEQVDNLVELSKLRESAPAIYKWQMSQQVDPERATGQ